MEEGESIFSCSGKKKEKEIYFSLRRPKKGRAEGKQVHEKKATCSEHQFCGGAFVYLLS